MLSYFVTDLTNMGMNRSFAPPFLDDEHIYKFNRPRWNFYKQFVEAVTSNDRSPWTVFGIENRTRHARETINEEAKKAANNLQYLTQKYTTDDLTKKITRMMKGNLFLKRYKFENGPKYTIGGGQTLDDLTKKVESLEQLKSNNKRYQEELNKVVIAYENDPILSPDNFKITSTDRVVAIAVAYVIRAVSLFLVEWGMNSYMIQGFESAFQTYLMLYIGMFLLVVTLANASDNMLLFRMVFYYFSIDPPNSIWRVVVHILVQLILLPVPFLVRDGNSAAPDKYSFESRRAVMRTLSQFTFFIWALTSAITFMY
jgi:hypothetical protein